MLALDLNARSLINSVSSNVAGRLKDRAREVAARQSDAEIRTEHVEVAVRELSAHNEFLILCLPESGIVGDDRRRAG